MQHNSKHNQNRHNLKHNQRRAYVDASAIVIAVAVVASAAVIGGWVGCGLGLVGGWDLVFCLRVDWWGLGWELVNVVRIIWDLRMGSTNVVVVVVASF
jgi:hypothetical protein